MTNPVKQILTLALILGLSSVAKGQYVNLQLTIEPEISAAVEQSLDFGTQVVQSGRHEIGLGDANMGIFSIRAFYTQRIFINLQVPDALEHTDPELSDRIPLDLNLSYNNSGTNNPDNSTSLPVNRGLVSIHESNSSQFNGEIWQDLYLYVYGAIEVGDIPDGEYTGDIVLSVDYE